MTFSSQLRYEQKLWTKDLVMGVAYPPVDADRRRRRGHAGKGGTPVLRVIAEEATRQELALALDEICRRGAERMLAAALEAETTESQRQGSRKRLPNHEMTDTPLEGTCQIGY